MKCKDCKWDKLKLAKNILAMYKCSECCNVNSYGERNEPSTQRKTRHTWLNSGY